MMYAGKSMGINEAKKIPTPDRVGIAKAKALKEYMASRNDLYFLYSHPSVLMCCFEDMFVYHPVKNKFVLKTSKKEADKIANETIEKLAVLQPSFTCENCENEIHKQFSITKCGKKNGEIIRMKVCRSCEQII